MRAVLPSATRVMEAATFAHGLAGQVTLAELTKAHAAAHLTHGRADRNRRERQGARKP